MSIVQPLLVQAPLLANETLLSLLIRLAQLNSYESPAILGELIVSRPWYVKHSRRPTDNINFPSKNETYEKLAALTLIDPFTFYRSTCHRFALILTPPPRSVSYLTLPNNISVPCFSRFHAFTQIRPTEKGQFCPTCLREEAYYRLNWIPVAISTCLQHQCLLVNRCQICNEEVSIYEIVEKRCDGCQADLSKAEAISIANDEVGLRAQEVLQSWFMDYLTPEYAAPTLPEQSPAVLYRVIEGLQSHIETKKPRNWSYLHHLHPDPGECISQHGKGNQILSPYRSYSTYTTAYKAIMNWPESFYEFLIHYRNEIENDEDRYGSRKEVLERKLISKPLQFDLGTLYTHWIRNHWSYPEFDFLQDAFNRYIADNYWLQSAVVRTKFYKKHPQLAESSKYVSITDAAGLLHTTHQVVELLFRNGRLTQPSASEGERVDRVEILSLRKTWHNLIPLEMVCSLLGTTEEVALSLAAVGWLDIHHGAGYKSKMRFSEVMTSLEKTLKYVRDASMEVIERDEWLTFAEAAEVFSATDFDTVTILIQIREGNLIAYHLTEGAFHIKSLLFAFNDLQNCVEALEKKSTWMGCEAATRLLNISDMTLTKWIKSGLISPLAVRTHTLYFDQERLVQWRREHVISDEVVQILGITRKKLSQLVKEGKLKPLEITNGRRYWFLKQAILELESSL